MRISDLTSTAVSGITVNRSRSLLTMLGIIIGVASVVLMVSMGRSFQNYVLNLIAGIGTNTVDVFPTGFEKFGGNLDSLTLEDYEAVRRLPTVERAVPIILVGKPVQYGRESVSPMVMGTRADIFRNYGLELSRGRLLDDRDDEGAKSVAVLGAQTAEDLFGNRDPLGENIKVGGQTFTVVGVLRSQGSLLTQDLDRPVFIPFRAARALTGQKHLSFMNMKAVGDPAVAIDDITALLRERHRIENPADDPDQDDFRARSGEQISQIVGTVTLGLTVFLGLVAAISLLVGGIGIMNIMLVSVTERTREIGLRKAVGARRRDILLQFLLEAVSLTFSGGIIGLVLGISAGWFLSRIADRVLGGFAFSLSIPGVLLAVGMAVGVGLLFGIYPAKRAAELSPMEALRYE